MPMSQADKARAFAALHEPTACWGSGFEPQSGCF